MVSYSYLTHQHYFVDLSRLRRLDFGRRGVPSGNGCSVHGYI